MRIFIASLVAALFTLLTTFALVRTDLDRGDLAVPVVISGLWIVGALGLIGLGLWGMRDIQARRRRNEDATQS
jgi:hypothetical protein